MVATFLLLFVPALLVGAVLTAVMRRLSPLLGYVDHPGGRKNHPRPMPLGGGVAVFVAMSAVSAAGFTAAFFARGGCTAAWVPVLLSAEAERILSMLPLMMVIMGGGLVLVLLGVLDDLFDLHALLKLLVEVAVAVLLVLYGVRATLFIANPYVSGLVSVLWIVGVINAFNFMDNMDGLCAGCAVVSAAVLSVVALLTNQYFVAALLFVYMGALCGFLLFNFPPASIFLGDAGSLFVGYVMAVSTLVFTFGGYGEPALKILAPVLVLSVPLFDMAYVLAIRVWQGRNVFTGDHNHVSHRLLALGMRPPLVAVTVYLMTFCTALAAFMLTQLNFTGAVCAVIQVVSFLGLIFLIEGMGRYEQGGGRGD